MLGKRKKEQNLEDNSNKKTIASTDQPTLPPELIFIIIDFAIENDLQLSLTLRLVNQMLCDYIDNLTHWQNEKNRLCHKLSFFANGDTIKNLQAEKTVKAIADLQAETKNIVDTLLSGVTKLQLNEFARIPDTMATFLDKAVSQRAFEVLRTLFKTAGYYPAISRECLINDCLVTAIGLYNGDDFGRLMHVLEIDINRGIRQWVGIANDSFFLSKPFLDVLARRRATAENLHLVDFLIRQNAPVNNVKLLKRFIGENLDEEASKALIHILKSRKMPADTNQQGLMKRP